MGCLFDDNQMSFQAVSTLYPHLGKSHIFPSKTPEKHLHNKRVSLPKYFSVARPDSNSALRKTKIWQLNRCWNVLICEWRQSHIVARRLWSQIPLSVSVVHPKNFAAEMSSCQGEKLLSEGFIQDHHGTCRNPAHGARVPTQTSCEILQRLLHPMSAQKVQYSLDCTGLCCWFSKTYSELGHFSPFVNDELTSTNNKKEEDELNTRCSSAKTYCFKIDS